jgi:hypothetical protein
MITKNPPRKCPPATKDQLARLLPFVESNPWELPESAANDALVLYQRIVESFLDDDPDVIVSTEDIEAVIGLLGILPPPECLDAREIAKAAVKQWLAVSRRIDKESDLFVETGFKLGSMIEKAAKEAGYEGKALSYIRKNKIKLLACWIARTWLESELPLDAADQFDGRFAILNSLAFSLQLDCLVHKAPDTVADWASYNDRSRYPFGQSILLPPASAYQKIFKLPIPSDAKSLFGRSDILEVAKVGREFAGFFRTSFAAFIASDGYVKKLIGGSVGGSHKKIAIKRALTKADERKLAKKSANANKAKIALAKKRTARRP